VGFLLISSPWVTVLAGLFSSNVLLQLLQPFGFLVDPGFEVTQLCLLPGLWWSSYWVYWC
jgi:hypothetical protein